MTHTIHISKKTITKSEMRKMSVQDCLRHIYKGDVIEESIHEVSKDKLADFILEVFNKGLLTDYLNLKF